MKTWTGVAAFLFAIAVGWQAQAQQQTVPTENSLETISRVPAQTNPAPLPPPAASQPMGYGASQPPAYRQSTQDMGYGETRPTPAQKPED